MSYQLTPEGLIFVPKPKKEDDEPEPIWLCAPIEMKALCQDCDDRWGRTLEWADPDGNSATWNMPAEYLADPKEIWKGFLSRGLAIAPGKAARELLLLWLTTQKPEARIRTVDAVVWHTGDNYRVFVLPDSVYGDQPDRKIVYKECGADNPYEVRGTVREWITHIGSRCVGNSRLVLSVSVGFAAPLLGLIPEDGGGIHFKGESSTGKTTAGHVGASIYGRPKDRIVKQWRGTDNGLEAVFEMRNDCLVVLDELAQVDPRVAGKTAYMLVNGEGKMRMGRDTELRKPKRWRLLFISTGEISLADKMSEDGLTPRAGQEVRMLDIPADAGKGIGIFENLHGESSPADFAEKLKLAASKYYGAPFRAFIAAIIQVAPADLRDLIMTLRDRFISNNLPAHASGQVRRVCALLGLIAGAGIGDWSGYDRLGTGRSRTRCGSLFL